MKISEFVQLLQEIQEIHGDVPVLTYTVDEDGEAFAEDAYLAVESTTEDGDEVTGVLVVDREILDSLGDTSYLDEEEV